MLELSALLLSKSLVHFTAHYRHHGLWTFHALQNVTIVTTVSPKTKHNKKVLQNKQSNVYK